MTIHYSVGFQQELNKEIVGLAKAYIVTLLNELSLSLDAFETFNFRTKIGICVSGPGHERQCRKFDVNTSLLEEIYRWAESL